jgi:large subunit ribosomal protein L3
MTNDAAAQKEEANLSFAEVSAGRGGVGASDPPDREKVGADRPPQKVVSGLIGRKIGMTQLFTPAGEVIPITVVEAGPNRVVQKKTKDRDGYEAVRIGFGEVKEKRLPKPEQGVFKKASLPFLKDLREVKGNPAAVEVGAVLDVDQFEKGERVDVTGISKGKGFQGVIKRHHFAGGPAGHGSMFYRAPGSIGSSSFPSRVWKGKKLPGHMGAKRVTVQNLEVVEVRKDQHLLFLRGAVPGSPGSLLLIRRTRKA